MCLNGACQVSRLRQAVRAMRKEIAALDLRLGVCAHSLKVCLLALALQAVNPKSSGPHCTSFSVSCARARALFVWFIANASLSPLHNPLVPDPPVAQICPLTGRCETGHVTTQ